MKHTHKRHICWHARDVSSTTDRRCSYKKGKHRKADDWLRNISLHFLLFIHSFCFLRSNHAWCLKSRIGSKTDWIWMFFSGFCTDPWVSSSDSRKLGEHAAVWCVRTKGERGRRCSTCAAVASSVVESKDTEGWREAYAMWIQLS